MRKFAGIVALFVLLSSFPLSAGQLKPDEKKALELKPAVVLVVVQFKTRWTLEVFSRPIDLSHTETGTGFLFRPDGYLVTNGHVVADANLKDPQASEALKTELRRDFLEALRQGAIFRYIETQIGRSLTPQERVQVASSAYNITISQPTLKVILPNGKAYDADILQYSGSIDQHGKDVAILKIPANNLPTVSLGNSDNVRLQDQIMVMGYPGLVSPWGGGSVSSIISAESSLEPTATNGHISALKTESIGTPLLQSDVAITHGNSGGPAFNDQGEVIGLATYGAQEVQGFNFLVPINTAMEFVRQAGVAPEVGSFNKHWANALDYYDAGQCNKAIGEFDNIAPLMPNLPDAAKYRASAVSCVDNMSAMDKMMESVGKGPLIGIVAAVVLVLTIVLVRRRSPVPAPVRAQATAASATVSVAEPPRPLRSSEAPTVPVLGTGTQAGGGGVGVEWSYGRIQFIAGPLSGRTFKVEKEGLWIGRDSSKCAVVVPDDAISGQHAWVVPIDGGVVVIDKGSTNGTYVNSLDSPRISKIGLNNGDRVYLGKKGLAAFAFFSG